MLTGESTPIIKSHLPILKNISFNYENDKHYILFAGTKIVQKRKIDNEPVIAMVYNIGFNSIKGNLIRSILFPKDLEIKFKNDSIKYIKFMGILTIIENIKSNNLVHGDIFELNNNGNVLSCDCIL